MKKKLKGFTLIELMIVIIILSILSTIVISQYIEYKKNAYKMVALVALSNINKIQNVALNDKGCFATNYKILENHGLVKDNRIIYGPINIIKEGKKKGFQVAVLANTANAPIYILNTLKGNHIEIIEPSNRRYSELRRSIKNNFD